MFQQIKAVSIYLSAAMNCKRGTTAIEYGLIAAGVGIAILTGIGTLKDGLNGLFGDIAGKLK